MALTPNLEDSAFDWFLADVAWRVTPKAVAKFGPSMDEVARGRRLLRAHKTLQARRDEEALRTWMALIGRSAIALLIEHAIATRIAQRIGDPGGGSDRRLSTLQAQLLRDPACAPIVASYWLRGIQRFCTLTQSRFSDAKRAEFAALAMALSPTEILADADDAEQAERIEEALMGHALAAQAARPQMLRSRPLKPRKRG